MPICTIRRLRVSSGQALPLGLATFASFGALLGLACSTPITQEAPPTSDTSASLADAAPNSDAAQGTEGDTDLGHATETDAGLALDEAGCADDDACEQPEDSPCQRAECNLETGTCTLIARANDTPCDDGDPCTADARCLEGRCGGASPAQPACDGLQCGDDGCGNPCGACDPGVPCNQGQCEPPESDPSSFSCETVSFEGCCTGEGKSSV